VSVHHYENFPVASLLCPRELRPAVTAIYRFARTADDLADEGTASSERRLLDLAAYRRDLLALAGGERPGTRWAGVFDPLGAVLHDHALPLALFTDLLSAFEQDVVKPTYADRSELLDYCRRSANPIGRLLLHLYGVGGAQLMGQSDAICSALQLANFWQDLSVDTRRGRLYLPLADCARHGVAPDVVLGGVDSPALRRLVADQVAWTRELMLRGAPLAHAIPGRAGWELRLVIQGGLRILEKIERLDFATLQQRPVLRGFDAPPMLWRAVAMRAARAAVAQESA
jgi:squalene synthase HpnC